jgi:hypothetical protein
MVNDNPSSSLIWSQAPQPSSPDCSGSGRSCVVPVVAVILALSGGDLASASMPTQREHVCPSCIGSSVPQGHLGTHKCHRHCMFEAESYPAAWRVEKRQSQGGRFLLSGFWRGRGQVVLGMGAEGSSLSQAVVMRTHPRTCTMEGRASSSSPKRSPSRVLSS